MTSAEWVCWLDFLGLNNRWAAKQFGVNVRTVRKWAGMDVVPSAAEAAIRQWATYTERLVSKLTVSLSDSADAGGQPVIYAPQDDEFMANGMPPRWYRMVSARVAERTGFPIVWKL